MTATPSPQSVVVPVEPTEAMIEAFYHAEGPAGPDRVVSWSVATAMARGNVFRHLDDIFANAYRAMLAAAPAPSSLAGGEWRPNPGFNPLPGERVDIRWGGDDAARTEDDGDLSDAWSWDLYDGKDQTDTIQMWRPHVAALSPEAPAREVGDLEELLATAIAAELEDGGAEVPYSVIAERVAARVADEATSAPSFALTTAAEEALSFLQNAPLESGICCCGDPISGHGDGSGHSPVDDLAYHSSQVAEKLKQALTPRHEAPASDGEREPLCMAYKTGYADGVEDSNGMFDRESCEEGWGQYAEKLSAQPALPARLPLPTVDDGRGGRRPINPQDDR